MQRSVDADREIRRVLDQARADRDVLAVVLFGSRARGDARAESDVDLCLVLASPPRDPFEVGRKLLDYAMHADLDLQVFQRLPLYVRRRVLKEGCVLFVRDEEALYDLALRTARAFESFRPRYEAYLAEVARARP